jgi:putative transposase
MNRGTRKGLIFHQTIDRIDFLELLADAGERAPVKMIAFSLMDTHFHLVLQPEEDTAISAYMQWLMNAHLRQYRRRYGGRGEGHIYQGRYKNVSLPGYEDLFRVTRYVEANARNARVVDRAEDWPWCSLATEVTPSGRALLCGDLFPRPAGWLELVNTDWSGEELRCIAAANHCGLPLDQAIAAAQQPKSARGRPRKWRNVAATN